MLNNKIIVIVKGNCMLNSLNMVINQNNITNYLYIKIYTHEFNTLKFIILV